MWWCIALTASYFPGEDGTFAQNYQDIWVAAVAGKMGWKRGFFFDLGAYKGLECSNTALLDKTLNWKGVAVEPRAFEEGFNFLSRPNTVLVKRAMLGITNQNLLLGGGDGQIFEVGRRGARQAKIKSINMADLIKCVENGCEDSRGSIHVPRLVQFVSMDVEGNEGSLLSTWPWDRITTAIFIIETGGDCFNCLCNRNCQRVRSIMKFRNYVKLNVTNPGVDEYYVLPFVAHKLVSVPPKAWRVHPKDSHGC